MVGENSVLVQQTCNRYHLQTCNEQLLVFNLLRTTRATAKHVTKLVFLLTGTRVENDIYVVYICHPCIFKTDCLLPYSFQMLPVRGVSLHAMV